MENKLKQWKMRARELSKQGMSYSGIARQLNEEGFRAARGGPVNMVGVNRAIKGRISRKKKRKYVFKNQEVSKVSSKEKIVSEILKSPMNPSTKLALAEIVLGI